MSAAAAGLASLQHVADAADKVMAADPQGVGDTYSVLGVQRPAEIVNYQSTGDTPAILAAGLRGGAVVALATTLAASVRRRRRDLALLKTLGFTRRQLAVTVAWQASVAAIVGIVDGRAGRDRPWPLALGPVRPRHLRRPRALGAGARESSLSLSLRSCWPTSSPPSPGAWPPERRRPWCCGRNEDGQAARHPVEAKS